jgi:hypothetical protein
VSDPILASWFSGPHDAVVVTGAGARQHTVATTIDTTTDGGIHWTSVTRSFSIGDQCPVCTSAQLGKPARSALHAEISLTPAGNGMISVAGVPSAQPSPGANWIWESSSGAATWQRFVNDHGGESGWRRFRTSARFECERLRPTREETLRCSSNS